MAHQRSHSLIAKGNLTEGWALLVLLVLFVLCTAGPSGILAWSENRQLLEQRQHDVKRLVAERDQLRNRVALLNPQQTDPDLAGELLRKDLNVVHEDDVVMLLSK